MYMYMYMYILTLHYCMSDLLINVSHVLSSGLPGAPPAPPFGMMNQGPNLKEKKKYKLDVQMRRMNWNQVRINQHNYWYISY